MKCQLHLIPLQGVCANGDECNLESLDASVQIGSQSQQGPCDSINPFGCGDVRRLYCNRNVSRCAVITDVALHLWGAERRCLLQPQGMHVLKDYTNLLQGLHCISCHYVLHEARHRRGRPTPWCMNVFCGPCPCVLLCPISCSRHAIPLVFIRISHHASCMYFCRHHQ